MHTGAKMGFSFSAPLCASWRGGYAVLMALLWLIRPDVTGAWWDGGHMLIGEIARQHLSDDEINALETPLKRWSDQPPELNTFPAVTVWADHIKCSQYASHCAEGSTWLDDIQEMRILTEGKQFIGKGKESAMRWMREKHGLTASCAVSIFNPWHWDSVPYNPENITLSKAVAGMPYPDTGSVWFLETVAGADMPTRLTAARTGKQRRLATQKSLDVEANVVGEAELKPNFSKNKLFSSFAWNMKLRFFVHIFGDLHQPLHPTATFSKKFPNSDLGGTLVSVDFSRSSIANETCAKIVRNLHDTWDSCGGFYTTAFPTFSSSDVYKEAVKIINEVPLKSVQKRVDEVIRFDDVAAESLELVKTVVYSEIFPVSNGAPLKNRGTISAARYMAGSAQAYEPSDAYIAKTREVCIQQIAVGGYRLARYLKQYAAAIKNAQWT